MNFIEHLKGLARLEDNIGKKVAFDSSATRIAELERYNVGLANEVVELQAHVERLRSVLDAGTSAVEEILNETPAQSLAEIKAAAIEEAVAYVECWFGDFDNPCERQQLLNRAQKLREGEK